jgi:hypothetical protein
MLLCLISVVGSGTNCTDKSYALTSKQNEAHIYVGTVIGAIMLKLNLPRWGEALPPLPVQCFLLSDNYFLRPSVKPNYLHESLALKVKQTTYLTLLSMRVTAMQSIRALSAA